MYNRGSMEQEKRRHILSWQGTQVGKSVGYTALGSRVAGGATAAELPCLQHGALWPSGTRAEASFAGRPTSPGRGAVNGGLPLGKGTSARLLAALTPAARGTWAHPAAAGCCPGAASGTPWWGLPMGGEEWR